MRQSSLVWEMLLASFITVVGIQPSVSLSQEATPAKPTAEKAPTKRLPAYYKDVVTEAQRENIYKIQEKYNGKISILADEIKTLQAARNAEIEALLSTEQKTKLDAVKAAAAKKRAANAAAARIAAPKVSTPATAVAPVAAPAASAPPAVPSTPVRPATK